MDTPSSKRNKHSEGTAVHDGSGDDNVMCVGTWALTGIFPMKF